MNKTDKSKLMHRLEKYQHIDEEQDKITSQSHIDVTINDAMFLLHTLKMPETYGAFTYKLLQIAVRCSPATFAVCHLLLSNYKRL